MKAGSLDDTSDLQPACHIWTRRAQRWLNPVLSGSTVCEEEPESEEMLKELWMDASGIRD